MDYTPFKVEYANELKALLNRLDEMLKSDKSEFVLTRKGMQKFRDLAYSALVRHNEDRFK